MPKRLGRFGGCAPQFAFASGRKFDDVTHSGFLFGETDDACQARIPETSHLYSISRYVLALGFWPYSSRHVTSINRAVVNSKIHSAPSVLPTPNRLAIMRDDIKRF